MQCSNPGERKAKILGAVLLAFLGVYAVISCIFQFVRGKDGLADGFITLAIGGVFCAIIGFSFFGKWAAFMRKMKRAETAEVMDAEYKNVISPPKKADKIKIKPKKKRRYSFGSDTYYFAWRCNGLLVFCGARLCKGERAVFY